MKKVLAVLLVLATLIPLGLIPVASADEVTAKPFYSLGWSDFDEKTYPYLDGLITSNFKTIGDKVQISYGGTMAYGSYTDADVTKVATALKKDLEARPEGLRYWHVFGPGKAYSLAPQNVVFLDFGIDQLKDLMTALLKKMKEIGAPLDGMVVDTEYIHMSSYYIYTEKATKDPLIYSKIVKDPRYATEIRPLLVERGFKFWPAEEITDYTPEIYAISRNVTKAEYQESKNIWDTVMRNRLNEYINEWCFNPLKENYPNANLSDYQSIDGAPWLKMAAVTDDGAVISGGKSIKPGDTSSYSYYYSRPSASFYENHNQYAGYTDALFEGKPFNNLLYDINFTRYMYEASDTKKIAPWITSYIYGGKKDRSMAYTPYYSELLYHLGMFDPQPFLSYTYVNEYAEKGQKPSYTSPKYILTQQIMNDVLAELTRVAGYSDRKPIAMPMNWNTKFVLSGMYANGRNIWRITPDTTIVSVADFKVEGTDPTFRVNGQTVTFPGGKIIADTNIENCGSCGYWVETAKDVTPVITNDADRFAKYPSLLMDFEDAKEGTFDYNTSAPVKAWEFTWKNGGKSNIVAQNGNKVLSINKTTSVRSINLPGNVTAGDSYAKDQAWEITVTVPEGLAAAAEVNLLKYTGNSQAVDDGGFKIQGGKLYYSQLKADATDSEYVELMDIAAGTYTLKRVMDFNDNKACATYYVYDAAGTELKASAKVATPAFSTIKNVEFACVGADKDVLLDNFKLTVTGIAVDVGTYHAKTGMVESPTATNAFSTAYRVSWLNATAAEGTATIAAEIYEGTTLKETKTIKEVKMAPGYDGVETGIVEIAEGQSVKIVVTSNAKVNLIDPNTPDPVPENPATNPSAPAPSETAPAGDAKKGDNTLVIVLIAVAAVAVVAVVLVLVLTKKKPEAKTEEKAEEEKPEEKTEE